MVNCLITGGSSGLGLQAAEYLAAEGFEVMITSRSLERARAACEKIRSKHHDANIRGYALDLSDLESVREFAKTFASEVSSLDVLLNNAGAYYARRMLSPQGVELTFAGNHLGHFLLTYLLLDLVRKGEKKRIVNVSSAAHTVPSFNFEDYNREKSYSGFRVYGESKLANLFFTYKLAEKVSGEGITSNALHPGFVATNFAKNNGLLFKLGMILTRPFQKSRKSGAKTHVYLASSPEVEGVTGKYFVNSRERRSSKASMVRESWDRLWSLSEELCGINW